jgi:DNA-binding GntR family transcriptional regulator
MTATSVLRTVSVVDATVEALRSAVFSGELEPGTPITEAAMMQRFDVPRPTIRSAMQLLMQDGLLRREPNRSVYVPLLSNEDVQDLFSVRRMVELDCVQKLVAQKIYPTLAMRILRLLEALDEHDGWDEVVQYDFELHQALIDAVASPRLSKIYASISAEVRLALTQLRGMSPVHVAAEHRVLLDAIRSFDEQRAVQATREHLAESEQAILNLLTGGK